MLVLTRKLQERIKIGDNVTITVLRVKGNTVRIGIEAPRSVRVIRAELPAEGELPAEAIAADSPAASLSSDQDQPSSEDDAPPAASPLRFPQRRMTNRSGMPPLRLACSHALADSGVLS